MVTSPHVPEGTNPFWKLILWEKIWWRYVFLQSRCFGWLWTTLGRNLFPYILHLYNQQYGILLFHVHFFSSLSSMALLALVFWLKISSTGVTYTLLEDFKNRWVFCWLPPVGISPLSEPDLTLIFDSNELELQEIEVSFRLLLLPTEFIAKQCLGVTHTTPALSLMILQFCGWIRLRVSTFGLGGLQKKCPVPQWSLSQLYPDHLLF